MRHLHCRASFWLGKNMCNAQSTSMLGMYLKHRFDTALLAVSKVWYHKRDPVVADLIIGFSF